MFKQLRKNGIGWKRGLLLCIDAVAAALYYSEQPAPRAEGYQPPNETWVPQFGNGTNPGGLGFSSTITLINLSTTTSQVSVLSFGGAAGISSLPLLRDPISGEATSSMGVLIPASGSAHIDSMNPNPNEINTGGVGIFSSNRQVVSQTEFSIFNNGQLKARAQGPGRKLRTMGSFPIGESGRTGVALLNPFSNSGAAAVGLAGVGPNGKAIDVYQTSLEPGTRISKFLDELMNVQGATSAEFRSNVPVAILPLQQDGLVLTTQDVFPERGLESLFGGP